MQKLKSKPDLSRSEIIKIIAVLPSPQTDGAPLVGRLSGLDLHGVDLHGLDLSYIDLCDTSFAGCDLRDALLSHSLAMNANFDCADLRGATLEGTTVNHCTFREAKLARITAQSLMAEVADFTDADFTDANVMDAQMPFCKWKGAKLVNVDARGLMLGSLDDLQGAEIAGGQWTDVRQWGGSEHDDPIYVAPFIKGDATKRPGLITTSRHA